LNNFKAELSTIITRIENLKKDKNYCDNYSVYNAKESELTLINPYTGSGTVDMERTSTAIDSQITGESKVVDARPKDNNHVTIHDNWLTRTVVKEDVYSLPPSYMSIKDPSLVSLNPMPDYNYVGNSVFVDIYSIAGKMHDNLDFSGKIVGEYIEKDFNIDCRYYVNKNEVFNPNDDDNDNLYPGDGTFELRFRVIALDNLFPNDSIPKNWSAAAAWKDSNSFKKYSNSKDYLDSVEAKQYSIYADKPIYSFDLSPTDIVNIKVYNDTHGYLDYSLYTSGANKGKSIFLNENFDSVIINDTKIFNKFMR